MIGGEVALALDPAVLRELAAGVRSVTVTGTNGKSTTTRMVRAALSTIGPILTDAPTDAPTAALIPTGTRSSSIAPAAPGAPGVRHPAPPAVVASNVNGDNMPPGIVTALMSTPGAQLAALEVDEMHLPVVARDVDPAVMVLLNLSRDQLDRVGEIGSVERRLRAAVDRHPRAVIIANCDDPLIASAAWGSDRVVWVAAGSGWGVDSVGFPRGGRVVRDGSAWWVVDDQGDPGDVEQRGEPVHGASGPARSSVYRRPTPDWWLEDAVAGGSVSTGDAGAHAVLCGPHGTRQVLRLALPGLANLGNAAQAVAAAVALGARVEDAVAAVGAVREVAGRYAHYDVDGRDVRVMLAKNPAGWQEALTMVDPAADQVVVAVNGQVPDGQDLSWLWDVDFSLLDTGRPRTIVACGERGADLAVRMEYAGLTWTRTDTPMEALARCHPGHVELLANYTAFRDLRRVLDARAQTVDQEA